MSLSTSLPELQAAQIQSCALRIAPHIRRTPVMQVAVATPSGEQSINLKLEHLQHAGSFKARGAFNRLLSNLPASAADRAAQKVVAASGGNHGIAVAYAARQLGVPAHIFVPTITAQAKLARLKNLGAQVHQVGDQYAEALQASLVFAKEQQALISHAYDQVETLQGQATLALEWQAQAPEVQTVLVAVGGGGLIGGMSAWYRGNVKVVAVETEGCATLHRSLEAGQHVDIAPQGLAADALGARRVGELMFPLAQQFIAASVLVRDEDVKHAQRYAWQEWRMALEPAGATALASLLSGAYQPLRGERLGVLLCGANVDLATLS